MLITGSPNFTKHLTNKDTLLVPKNVRYKTFVNTLYKNVNCCELRRGFNCTMQLYMPEVELIKCGFSKIQKNY
jgi:hypothetical protein